MNELRIALLSSTAADLSSMRAAYDRTRHRTVVHAIPAVLWCNGTREDDTDVRLAAVRESAPPGTAVVAGRVGELAGLLRPHTPDVLIVYGYPAMLPPAVLAVPRLGAINCHSGDLPRLRGPAPVPWALRDGDPYIGLTVHRMVAHSYDSGPILAQGHTRSPLEGFDPDAFHVSVVRGLLGLLPTALAAVEAGWVGRSQEHEHASAAPFMRPADRVLNLERPAQEVHHLIRALRYTRSRPLLRIGDDWHTIDPTSSLTQTADCPTRVECADGPLWVAAYLSPAEPPETATPAAACRVEAPAPKPSPAGSGLNPENTLPDNPAAPGPTHVAARSIDVSVASDARMQNHLLGGIDCYPSDEDACDALKRIAPRMPAVARAARAYIERVVYKLANEYEVTQFLDLGCGLATARNVHNIAQDAHRHARIVYVDYDPMVLGWGRMLLDQNDDIAVVDADVTGGGLLSHPDITRLIDPALPTAVLLNGVLDCMPDDADPAALINRVTSWLTGGGFIAVGHLVSNNKRVRRDFTDLMIAATGGSWGRVRERDDIHAFLDPLPLLGPGLTNVSSWHPDVQGARAGGKVFAYGGVADLR